MCGITTAAVAVVAAAAAVAIIPRNEDSVDLNDVTLPRLLFVPRMALVHHSQFVAWHFRWFASRIRIHMRVVHCSRHRVCTLRPRCELCAHHWKYKQNKHTFEKHMKFAYCTNVQRAPNAILAFFRNKLATLPCIGFPIPPFPSRIHTSPGLWTLALFLPLEVVVSSSVLVQHFWLAHASTSGMGYWAMGPAISWWTYENKIKRLLFRMWWHVICTSGEQKQNPISAAPTTPTATATTTTIPTKEKQIEIFTLFRE